MGIRRAGEGGGRGAVEGEVVVAGAGRGWFLDELVRIGFAIGWKGEKVGEGGHTLGAMQRASSER